MSAEPPEQSRDQQTISAPVRRDVPIAPTGDVHVLAFLLSAINRASLFGTFSANSRLSITN